MSDLLESAAAALNAPADLVQRSAAARAQATGSTVEEILGAWAGGAPAPAPAVADTTPEPPVAAAESAPDPAPAPVAEEPAAPEPVAAPAVLTVAVAEAAEPEPAVPVEPVPLGERVRAGAKSGAFMGAVMALFNVLFSIQWLLPRASLSGSEGDFSPAIEVVPGWVVLGSALLGLVSGVVIAGASRMMTGWRGPAMRLIGTGRSSLFAGGTMGALVGLVLGALLAGLTEPVGENLGLLPVAPAIGWTLGAWIVGGWLVGIVVQTLATPDAVAASDSGEVEEVRSRLGSAYGIPVAALVAILLLVLPAAYVFLLFPSWAPVLGMFIAASILGFAGLSAARPGMRITSGEFLLAAAGIAIVVVIVASVLSIQGAGHGAEEEDHSPESAIVLVVL